MANNRLYLQNKKNRTEFLLAKNLGQGWYLFQPETLVDRLDEWLQGDNGGFKMQGTDIVIVTENDEGFEYMERRGNE